MEGYPPWNIHQSVLFRQLGQNSVCRIDNWDLGDGGAGGRRFGGVTKKCTTDKSMEVYYICCFKKWKTNRLINQPTITSNNFYSRTQGVTRFVTFETEKHMIMDWGRLKGYYHFSFSAPIPLENLPPSNLFSLPSLRNKEKIFCKHRYKYLNYILHIEYLRLAPFQGEFPQSSTFIN